MHHSGRKANEKSPLHLLPLRRRLQEEDMTDDMHEMAKAHTWLTSSAAEQALVYLHYSYPLVLLFVYLTTFTVHSIKSSAPVEESPRASSIHTGPGGKPLPPTKRLSKPRPTKNKIFSPGARLTFCWLTVGVVLTFLANSILICAHALVDRNENWWCGKSVAVSVSYLMSSDQSS